MRFSLAALAFLLSMLLGARVARATACSGIRVEARDVSIKLTPDTPCISVAPRPIGCGDKLATFVENKCATPLTIPPDFFCAASLGGGAEPCTPLKPGDSAWTFATAVNEPSGTGKLLERSYSMKLDAQVLDVRVSYREVNPARPTATPQSPDAPVQSQKSRCAVAGALGNDRGDASWPMALAAVAVGVATARRRFLERARHP